MELTLHKQIRKTHRCARALTRWHKRPSEFPSRDGIGRGTGRTATSLYVLAEGDTVLANASVNVMDFLWCGQSRRYIQIGTVMTEETHRDRGLSRRLITAILAD